MGRNGLCRFDPLFVVKYAGHEVRHLPKDGLETTKSNGVSCFLVFLG